MVQDFWGLTIDLRAQFLAQQGYVVLKVDNASPFRPVVSGSWAILAGSSPAMQAAVARRRPAAAPPVTMPASAPVARAMIALARSCNSSSTM
ncbi:MAG: hypothetical protein U0841_03470 [Chloroflexia bacterium]